MRLAKWVFVLALPALVATIGCSGKATTESAGNSAVKNAQTNKNATGRGGSAEVVSEPTPAPPPPK